MFLFSNKKLVLSEDTVRMYNGMLVNHKKENGAICTNMDGPVWVKSDSKGGANGTTLMWHPLYVES